MSGGILAAVVLKMFSALCCGQELKLNGIFWYVSHFNFKSNCTQNNIALYDQVYEVDFIIKMNEASTNINKRFV